MIELRFNPRLQTRERFRSANIDHNGTITQFVLGELPETGMDEPLGEITGLEVFHAGDYEHKGRFDAAFVKGLADGYDPSEHEAPVTLDHADDGPAYGWVKNLYAVGEKLMADLHKVPRSMIDAIRSYRFPKRSIEFWRDPKDGSPVFGALSFLGAAIPHAKGMEDIEDMQISFAQHGEREMLEFETPRRTFAEHTEDPFPDKHQTLVEEVFISDMLGHYHLGWIDADGNGFTGRPRSYDHDIGDVVNAEGHMHEIKDGSVMAAASEGSAEHTHSLSRNITTADNTVRSNTMSKEDPKVTADPKATSDPKSDPKSATEPDWAVKLRADNERLRTEAATNRTEVEKMQAERFADREGTRFDDGFAEAAKPDSEGRIRVMPHEKKGLKELFALLPPDDIKMTFAFGKPGGGTEDAVETTPRDLFIDMLKRREPCLSMKAIVTADPTTGAVTAIGTGTADDKQAYLNRRADLAKKIEKEEKVPLKTAISMADQRLKTGT